MYLNAAHATLVLVSLASANKVVTTTMISTSALLPVCLMLFETSIVSSLGDNMIGPGLWRVLSAGACARDYPVQVSVARRRVNRTHDGFTARIASDRDIDDSYAVRVEICKRVDGGCKPYQVLADDSLPAFVRAYAGDNARAFLARAGLDPPDFPVPAGELEVQNFVFNYAELPAEGIYGEFGAAAFVVRGGEDVACQHFDVEFYEVEDDER